MTDATPKAAAKRRTSWRKRVLFVSIILLASGLLLEISCYIGIKCICRFRVKDLREFRQDVLLDTGAKNETREVVHPYLGWVMNPDSQATVPFEGRRYPINDFGLIDTQSPIHKRAPDRVIVAVIGGSVAWQTTVGGNEALLRELRRQPRFQGREVVLVRLAMNAYKQPQQLLMVTYLLSLGAEFDILINIDGYNEVALHESENGRHEVFPPFPRAWKARNSTLSDPRHLELLARHAYARKRQLQWATFCNQLPLQGSATVNFVWYAQETALKRNLADATTELLRTKIDNPGYQVTGPHVKFKSDAETTEYLADYWQSCSRQLNTICRANGIDYYQILPPNQRLLNSKPMDAEEREIALRHTAYAEAAARGYPLLIQKGAELKPEGIQFHDLTQLFREHREILYVDDCCHYNPTGNELLAIAVANIVGQKRAAENNN